MSDAGGITSLSDRELLIRIDTRLEGVIEDKRDHESRIRKIEVTLQAVEDVAEKAVTPKLLWAGAASAATVAISIIQLTDWLNR